MQSPRPGRRGPGLPTGGEAAFALCRACHDATYAALVAVAERAGLAISRGPADRLRRAG